MNCVQLKLMSRIQGKPGNAIILYLHQQHACWEMICSGFSSGIFGLKVQQQLQLPALFLAHTVDISWMATFNKNEVITSGEH